MVLGAAMTYGKVGICHGGECALAGAITVIEAYAEIDRIKMITIATILFFIFIFYGLLKFIDG